MLYEPTALTPGNYALASGSSFYKQRTGKVRAIVIHVTAGLQDLGMVAPDPSAEGTNKWALSTRAEVSWHRIADTDGVIRCLPSWATAWQAKGYNSNTVGIEISNLDARWDNKPPAWVKWTVWWAAVGVADWVTRYRVPIRRATRAELDRAIANGGGPVGFVDHSRLSTNRVDPGATFPWDLFFKYVRAIIAGAIHPDRLYPKAPSTTTPKEGPSMFLVKIRGTDPLYKSDGFRRVHVTPEQRDALKAGGVPITEVKDAKALAAYGPEVPA